MRLPGLGIVLRTLLLVSLVLSGTVAQGFMRVAGDDGMAVVLCTPEGPTEVWLTEDGRTLDEQPADHAPSETSGCLAITLSLVLVQAWLVTLATPAEFGMFRTVLVDRRHALVSDATPHQPRAPPLFS
ncbi:DUF2946 family protein [Oceaniglobus trochenteri]|uniref:DUF2946 family protein n=1 Tax=Oceaniglobus trochenteri TaxID=2763260 RepID=UPI001D00147A|nr:DUF2946 family protein [Oceaniglobus trochenteri]